MNRLTQKINRFDGTTHYEPRPSRQMKQYRYVDSGALILAQDQWDTAEQVRQHWAAEGERVDRDIAQRKAAEERAKRDRDNDVVNITLRSRYVSAGGDPATFEQDLPRLRREHAERCALGLDQPLNSTTALKEQLRAARAGRNLGAAPDPRPQS